jgi:hypothetical protein
MFIRVNKIANLFNPLNDTNHFTTFRKAGFGEMARQGRGRANVL